MPARPEPELTSPVDLCTRLGRLAPGAVGWSRRPLHRCNLPEGPRAGLAGAWPRRKRWSYWCVTTPDLALAVVLADVDYLGIAGVSFVDARQRRVLTYEHVAPLARGIRLPEVVEADVAFEHPSIELSVRYRVDGVALHVLCPSAAGPRIAADLHITRPPGHESLNVVIPWSERRFQFTSKQNTLPAAGTVEVGGERFRFEAPHAFACLDFGRGIWPYATAWNWASLSTRVGPETVGLNLGGKWTDGTGMTENGLCVGGRLHKISEDIAWEYDRRDWLAPWRIRTTESNRVDLVFEPCVERDALTNLVVLRSEVHQLFGHFSGALVAGGRAIEIERAFGWAEEHDARW